MPQLRVALAQVNPTVGDIDGNARIVLDWARRVRDQAAAGVSAYAMQPQLFARGCTNCHVQVHGSNSPSGKFWHR